MHGPDDLFQRYLGCPEERIGAAQYVFLDTDRGMTLMCTDDRASAADVLVRTLAETVSRIAGRCEFFGTFRRVSSRGGGLFDDVEGYDPPSDEFDVLTRNLLVWQPSPSLVKAPKGVVRRLEAEDADDAARMASAALGAFRAEALGLAPGEHLSMRPLTHRYAKFGVARGRMAWGAWEDGLLSALALRYYGSPISSNLLCQRTEVLVHPDLDACSADRLVYALLRAVQAAAEPSDYVLPLLVDSPRVGAAVQAGFEQTGHRYRHLLWRMESGRFKTRDLQEQTSRDDGDERAYRSANVAYKRLERVARVASGIA